MNRHVFIILMFALSLTATAGNRNYKEKKAAALSVLRSAATRAGTDGKAQELKTLEETSGFTILGYEDGGFAVIANDDRFNAVLGYSDEAYDAANVPVAFTWWKSAVNEIVSSDVAVSEPLRSSALPSEVAPLVTSTWGQGEPYNNMVKKYPAGCIATAMAQIMRYYQYPINGTGTFTEMNTPDGTEMMIVNLSRANYDWANMLDRYKGVSYTGAQATAVAKLLLHCGVASQMQYTSSGSGAVLYQACNALRNNFLYNENINIRYRDYTKTEDWVNQLCTELSEKRPVFYAGYDATYGGHAFVLDGYDASGLFHVNWGWDGDCNGYFDFALLNPASGSVKYQFSESQCAVFGFTTPDVTIEHRTNIVSPTAQNVTLNGTTLTVNIDNYIFYNLNDYTFSGTVSMLMKGPEGIEEVFNLYTAGEEADGETTPSLEVLNGLRYSGSGDLELTDDMPDGTYHLFFAARDKDTDGWTPVSYPDGVVCDHIIEKSGSSFTLTASEKQATTGIRQAMAVSGGKRTSVYDMQGVKVYESDSDAFNINNVRSKGVLIMKNESGTKKVLR